MARAATQLLASRVAGVRGRIEAAGGDPEKVAIVAVTKGFEAGTVLEALRCGLVDLGENYAAELTSKAASGVLSGFDPRWHYLGALQRNKLRRLAPFVQTWQGLSREVEVEALATVQPRARVMVQVSFDGRQGCAAGDVGRLVESARVAGLDVAGLMTVAPQGGLPAAEAAFSAAAELRERLGLAELSMGMSGDLETAVRHGATMLRLGTALFGPRPGAARMRQ